METPANFKKVVHVPSDGVKLRDETVLLPDNLKSGVDRVLISEGCIRERVKALAAEICKGKKEIHAVVVLRGAVIFFSDLIRHMSCDVSFDFVKVSSYEGTAPSGSFILESDMLDDVKDKEILLVDDIIDTGNTPKRLKEFLLDRKMAKSVKICSLLDKPARRKNNIRPDYTGFVVPDLFVVGYGMDCDGKFRNLPFIAAIGD